MADEPTLLAAEGAAEEEADADVLAQALDADEADEEAEADTDVGREVSLMGSMRWNVWGSVTSRCVAEARVGGVGGVSGRHGSARCTAIRGTLAKTAIVREERCCPLAARAAGAAGAHLLEDVRSARRVRE